MVEERPASPGVVADTPSARESAAALAVDVRRDGDAVPLLCNCWRRR